MHESQKISTDPTQPNPTRGTSAVAAQKKTCAICQLVFAEKNTDLPRTGRCEQQLFFVFRCRCPSFSVFFFRRRRRATRGQHGRVLDAQCEPRDKPPRKRSETIQHTDETGCKRRQPFESPMGEGSASPTGVAKHRACGWIRLQLEYIVYVDRPLCRPLL